MLCSYFSLCRLFAHGFIAMKMEINYIFFRDLKPYKIPVPVTIAPYGPVFFTAKFGSGLADHCVSEGKPPAAASGEIHLNN